MSEAQTAAAGGNAAIFYHPDGFVTSRDKLMGRHAAGEGFLRGLARHGVTDKLYAFSATRQHFEKFCDQARPHAGKRELVWLPHARPERLAEPGALFIPGPGLSAYAWQRRCRDRGAFSITGVTHTICTDRVMDSIGDLLIAPLEEWDALICTSDAVRTGAEAMLAAYGGYLAERFGAASPRPRLQLPVIPLGVDCDHLAAGPDADGIRARLRQRHRIGADDVVVLFFGRLSYHAKAHPLPMYQALEAAAKATGRKIVLILAGWFANDPIKQAFEQGAGAVCPSVRYVHVDGRKQEIRDQIWRAADIFCSLSDNVQETFGLTPVEAMAAGLPVVASDWDGYRGTVEHGVTGFLIPTTMPAAGSGAELAYRYMTGADTYDMYIGNVSQAIAVDAEATAQAFIELIRNPELCRRMGELGRNRARRLFDWRVIIGRYQALWAELETRRRQAAQPGQAEPAPLRGDPYAVFGHYATRLIDDRTPIRTAVPSPLKALDRLGALKMNNYARAMLLPAQDIQSLVRRVREAGELRVGDLFEGIAPERRPAMRRTVGWLAKLGIVKSAE